jgi:hypothetical protein
MPKGDPPALPKSSVTSPKNNVFKLKAHPKSQLDLSLSWRDRMFNPNKKIEEAATKKTFKPPK